MTLPKLAATLALATLSMPALAQYPDRPVHLIVPFAAASGTDQLARALGQAITDDTKATVVVENKPGASAMIGAAYVAKSAPDGYTVLLTTNTTHAANEHLYKKLPYDPVKDFTPITTVALNAQIMLVNAQSPVKSVGDFIALGVLVSVPLTVVSVVMAAANWHRRLAGAGLVCASYFAGQIKDGVLSHPEHPTEGRIHELDPHGPVQRDQAIRSMTTDQLPGVLRRPARGHGDHEPGEPLGGGHEEERRHRERDQQVLHHVHGVQVLLADVVHRPVGRHPQQGDGREEPALLAPRDRRGPRGDDLRRDHAHAVAADEHDPEDEGPHLGVRLPSPRVGAGGEHHRRPTRTGRRSTSRSRRPPRTRGRPRTSR